MDSSFEIRSTLFPNDMSAWCTEKSQHVVDALVKFVDWSNEQEDLPSDLLDYKNLRLFPALSDALKLLSFSCGAEWSPNDAGLIFSEGSAGYAKILTRYGLR